MSKTIKASKLSSAKFLAKRLGELSAMKWTVFVVDNRLFTEIERATSYARKLAKLTGVSSWIYKMEVPDAMPSVDMGGFRAVDDDSDRDYLDVPIYFVDGKPFLTKEEAENEAQTRANASGKNAIVRMANIEPKDRDFSQWCFPEKQKSDESESVA